MMKRLLLSILPLALLVACSDPKDEVEATPKEESAENSTAQSVEGLTAEEREEALMDGEMDLTRVNYVCPYDTNFTVDFSADGETATLYDQANREFTLTIAPAASGAFYKNDDGVSIHTKNDDAIVEFTKDKPINCTVWRGDNEESATETDPEAAVLYLNPRLNQ